MSWTKKDVVAEPSAEQLADAAEQTELQRRQWCIQQACLIEEARVGNLAQLAEEIYRYVYGARD